MKVLKNTTKRYLENDSGQIAVITAVVAVPLMLVVSLAVDTNLAERARVELQAALDSAALASISNQTIAVDERDVYAENRFRANVTQDENVTFNATSSENRIDVHGAMEVDTLFASLIGKDTIKFEAESAAEIVKGATVCMLALDPNSGRSFEVTRGAVLNANCSVQVNSTHNQASVVDHGGQATAQNFCIGGGVQGDHLPYVNTECSPLGDPYQDLDIPHPIVPCVDQEALNAVVQDWRSSRDAVDNHEISENARIEQGLQGGYEVVPTYFEKNHLQPGNYCEGLFLEAKELILDPGIYHITGNSLVFGEGTEIVGEDVTFVLHGEAYIETRNGSSLEIKGPTSGPLAGLVIAQSLDDKSMFNPTYPNVESTITEGAKLALLGTVYLPSHKVQFLGGSSSETHAPATAFIAHQISLSDAANIIVSVDHVTAGISPIEPRSDSSVRLVK